MADIQDEMDATSIRWQKAIQEQCASERANLVIRTKRVWGYKPEHVSNLDFFELLERKLFYGGANCNLAIMQWEHAKNAFLEVVAMAVPDMLSLFVDAQHVRVMEEAIMQMESSDA